MKKIPLLFQYENHIPGIISTLTDTVTPGCEWVIAGEGIATRKFDGTCCMIRDGKLYKRYDAKSFTVSPDGERNKWNRTPPDNWEPAQDPDPITGHWPGWVPVGDEKASKYHRDAFRIDSVLGPPPDGTYELCGPKIQGNPEQFPWHMLVKHGEQIMPDCPRDYEGLKAYLEYLPYEGVVFHHPDGRMCKIRRRDFFKK
jgi:hypothetical protein